jgi:FeS assembly SUF system regulator
MRLTHLADYAVVILTAAAARPGDDRLSASSLAADTGLPLPTTQKVLGKLGSAGLLTATRGIGGGFAFSRRPETITLADIIEAVEGPIAMTQCSGSDEVSDCALDSRCRLKPHMNIVSRTVRDALAGVTLEQLASERPLEDA